MGVLLYVFLIRNSYISFYLFELQYLIYFFIYVIQCNFFNILNSFIFFLLAIAWVYREIHSLKNGL